jgi:hypothetical protein
MPFLATMPTPMMVARKEPLFSVAPVSKTPATVPNRATTAEHDGDGFTEGTELDQKHGEHEQNGHQEREQEV